MKAERDAFYRSPMRAFEKAYSAAEIDENIELPLTREGFEELFVTACVIHQLPADDGGRSVLAGYVHHIANHINTTTLREIGIVLHKSISNGMTWQVDQELKETARAAAEKDKKPQEEPALNLVGSSDGTSSQGT